MSTPILGNRLKTEAMGLRPPPGASMGYIKGVLTAVGITAGVLANPQAAIADFGSSIASSHIFSNVHKPEWMTQVSGTFNQGGYSAGPTRSDAYAQNITYGSPTPKA